ncbi:MAG: response regulator [Candidatus Omnitrophota bacterium]
MAKKKVVVIDDEEDFCFLLSKLLEASGRFEVFLAYDGERGKNLVFEQKPDLIFLDYVMPRMRGDEVLDIFKKDERTKHIPIIMTSGLGEAAYVAKMIQKDRGEHFDEATMGRLPLPRDLTKDETFKLNQELRVDVFLEKPFSREKLFQAIEKTLGKVF